MTHESGDLPFQRRVSAERGIRQTGPTVSRRIQADLDLTGQCLYAVVLAESLIRFENHITTLLPHRTAEALVV
jgi:hypothetical protein